VTWRPWLQLVRLPAVFTAFSNVLAAQLIASGGRPDPGVLLAMLAASACLYLGGMALNDCCDIEVDRRERPARPLPSGQVPLRAAWRLALGLLAAGCALAALAGAVPFGVAVTLAVLIVLYDGLLKTTRLGPWVMAACRYANWLLGLAGSGLTAAAWLLPLPVFAYIIALTWLSRGEVAGGARGPIQACAAGLVASGLLGAILIGLGVLGNGWALLPAGIALGWLLWRLRKLAADPQPEQFQGVMKTLILGVVGVDALLVLAAGPWWGVLPVLALAVPGAWLARRIYVT
jgi:4-hydroxybenzoate polyprenyltransferase